MFLREDKNLVLDQIMKNLHNILNYSVVIPYGKKDGDINRSISSIFQQEVLPKQVIIICNNGITTDYAKSILEYRTEEINYIEVKKNINANIARNIGIDNCKTEWIAFLDSDDWWESGWITSVNNRITEKSPDFIYASISAHTQHKIQKLIAEKWQLYFTPENYLLAYRPAQTSTYFMKTSLSKLVRWNNNLRRHQDFDFFVRAMKQSVKTEVISECLVNVDWSTPRRHQLHKDCCKVVTPWKKNTNFFYFHRHIYVLITSAINSRNWSALPCLALAIILPVFSKIPKKQKDSL